MPTPYDIPASVLIKKLAKTLKESIDEIVPPKWAPLVKTGTYTQRPPEDPEWWFTRCASILRKIYTKGPVGIERLRRDYGGRIDRGVKREHARRGASANIRKILQQLEAAGLVETQKNRGRIVSTEGRRLLDKESTEIKEQLEKTVPELKKY